ncbi:TIGR02556 family CRISPR-associated protein [Candidatus Bathyarchaeota archaeon]|nr:TIGR02556 family CRISPR-associated protein [Candidatus Bathyarchaeota archaeon]
MIDAIRKIGEYSLKKKGFSLDISGNLVEILCDDPKSSETYKNLIKIELKLKDGEVLFRRVGEEAYDSSKIASYLYRRGSANGPDVTPISRVTDPNKTFNGKILAWFKESFEDEKYGLTEDEVQFIRKVGETISKNAFQILSEVNSRYDAIKKNKEGAILSLTFSSQGENKYLGDFPVFRKILLTKAFETFWSKYNTESKGRKERCSVCGEVKDEVFGFVSTYSFYTVDKPGMVAGGFRQRDAWRNYPVCQECAILLEEGKKYLEENSRFRFYDFDYYLIPKPILSSLSDEVYTILEDYNDEAKVQKINSEHAALLDSSKKEILGYLSEKPNSFVNDIMVFEESQSAFRILLHIEGVYPSRLKELFDAKNMVDKEPLFRAFNRGKPFQFDFGSLWYFFGRGTEADLSKYFLEHVAKIFLGRPVSYKFLLWAVNQKIQKLFANNLPTNEACLRGLSCIYYLLNLGLLGEYSNISDGDLEGSFLEEKTRAEKAEKLFESYPQFFDCDEKKAVFIVGALSQLLMDIQYSDRKSTPFRVKLQGLKLDQRLVMNLLPEIQNKLEEYDKNYYRDLETLASTYFIKAGSIWKISRDEISFYFTVGMNFASNFKSKTVE